MFDQVNILSFAIANFLKIRNFTFLKFETLNLG